MITAILIQNHVKGMDQKSLEIFNRYIFFCVVSFILTSELHYFVRNGTNIYICLFSIDKYTCKHIYFIGAYIVFSKTSSSHSVGLPSLISLFQKSLKVLIIIPYPYLSSTKFLRLFFIGKPPQKVQFLRYMP